MFKYAQIEANGVCFAVSCLSGEVNATDMILLAADDTIDYLGKVYTDGKWHEPLESEDEND